MNTVKQKLAIAEAHGWTGIEDYSGPLMMSAGSYIRGYPPHITPMIGKKVDLPDYLNDLNEMHEAEKTLNHLTPLYDCTLIQTISDGEFDMRKHPIASMHYVDALLGIHATASQRAEAFLKTIGKWVEE